MSLLTRPIKGLSVEIPSTVLPGKPLRRREHIPKKPCLLSQGPKKKEKGGFSLGRTQSCATHTHTPSPSPSTPLGDLKFNNVKEEPAKEERVISKK